MGDPIRRKLHILRKFFSLCGLYLIGRYILIKLYRKYKKLPSGPVGYPIFGSLLSIISKGHKYYIELAQQSDAKICTYSIGATRIYSINDVKLMKSVFDKDSALFLPKFYQNFEGPLSTHHGGPVWSKRRRFL